MLNPFRKVYTTDSNLNRIQDNIMNTFKSFIENVLLDGYIVEVTFSGVTTKSVDHKLGRKPLGWFVVGKTATTDVWVDSITNTTLQVNVASDVELKLFVF